jgi:hypothetical protein
MNDNQFIEMVERYLELKHKNYKTNSEMLAYQRGLLTRFIADLISDDFYALGKLKQAIKKLEKK